MPVFSKRNIFLHYKTILFWGFNFAFYWRSAILLSQTHWRHTSFTEGILTSDKNMVLFCFSKFYFSYFNWQPSFCSHTLFHSWVFLHFSLISRKLFLKWTLSKVDTLFFPVGVHFRQFCLQLHIIRSLSASN